MTDYDFWDFAHIWVIIFRNSQVADKHTCIWWQEGHLASNTLYQLPFMDCTYFTLLRRVLHFYFYKLLRAAHSSSRRNLEPKRAENLRLRFASSAHLLHQTEQKAKIMAERWRHWVNICNEKVVLSEYNSVSIINMLKTSNVEVIRVCFAGCY